MRVRWSIRKKLFLALITGGLVPIVILMALVTRGMLQNQRAESLREVTQSGELSQTVVAEVGQRMLSVAQAIAVEDDVVGLVTASDRTPLIRLSQDLGTRLDGVNVAFVDDVGSVWVKTGPSDPYGDNLLSSMGALRQALDGTPAYTTEVGGSLVLGIRGFAPIRQNGQVVGAVVVTQKVDDGFLATLREKTGLDSFVIFADGSTAGVPLDPTTVRGIRAQSGPGAGLSYASGHLASYYAWPLQNPNGTNRAFIGVVVPLTELEQSEAKLTGLAIWISLFALLFSLAAALWISRQVARPIERISRAAHAIADRQIVEIPPVTSQDELQDLSTSLRTMVGALSEQADRLNFVVGHAHAILWESIVERTGDPRLPHYWAIQVVDEAAAQRVVPLDLDEGEPYAAAWYLAKLSDDRTRMDAISYAAIEGGQTHYAQEFQCRGADGVIRWLRENVAIEPLAEGRWRLVGICIDITELRRAQEAAERLMQQNELILRSTADGIVVQDPSGRSIFANDAAARILGYQVNDLVGVPLHGLIHHHRTDGHPYPAEECPIAQVPLTRSARHVTDEVYWRKDGTSFPVEYTANPIVQPDGSPAVVVTFQDVSQRRAVERMKDEFVSVVSHELRTPLTAIRGSLGLLASGVLGPLPEKGQRMLEIAVNNTDRLVRLINDILDIERMESGKVTLDRDVCNAADLIHQAIEPLRIVAQKSRVSLVATPGSLRLYADADRLVQTLTNLVGNAIKFSPPGSTVRVLAERYGAEVRFQVRDQGRGIPADKLEAIFGRFQQVDASDSRDKGGSGLGLAICKSIILQHGGRIWAQSAPGEGSTFFFTLPDAPAAGSPEPASPAPAGAPTDLERRPGRTILLCAADGETRSATTAVLERQGYRVVSVGPSDDALALVSRARPDVILVDVGASGEGCGPVAALKASAECHRVPVVVFSVVPPNLRLAGDERPGDDPEGSWLETSLSRLVHFSARPPTVLVVEDDPDLAQVLVARFERHEIRAVRAASGREAIELSETLRPDLLVLDLVLPDGDGYSVVNWLRQHDAPPGVPLVVYSAKDLDESERERLNLGRTQFYTKGRITMEDFEQRVLCFLDDVVPIPREVSSR